MPPLEFSDHQDPIQIDNNGNSMEISDIDIPPVNEISNFQPMDISPNEISPLQMDICVNGNSPLQLDTSQNEMSILQLQLSNDEKSPLPIDKGKVDDYLNFKPSDAFRPSSDSNDISDNEIPEMNEVSTFQPMDISHEKSDSNLSSPTHFNGFGKLHLHN